MSIYDFQAIEKKWQEYWEENQTFEAKDKSKKLKFYILDMFPYPSGTGLHVGHPLGYIASDIVARFKRINEFNVLHPIGFDSFGLPAEQHAIRTGQHPSVNTQKNIERYKKQLRQLGLSFDWSREVQTTDPEYYKWTQWVFIQLYKKGLAYEADTMINWCPNDHAVLANEEVKNGGCERCGTPVERKKLKQWMLKITEYAERLLKDLDTLDWPESIKQSQVNWIGKSVGAEIDFKIHNHIHSLTIFTTRPETIYGATYMVIAPEHKLLKKITTDEYKKQVEDYVYNASQKSDLERSEVEKNKTGIFTGTYAVNPLTGQKIPIWVADYVLISYGTGAIMAVPGGDERDFEFAKKFSLPIMQVIAKDEKITSDPKKAYTGHGIMLNSGKYNGRKSKKVQIELVEELEKNKIGKKSIKYKLRDWIFSRQRYWGEPIPIVHCKECGAVPIPEEQLPLILPDMVSYTAPNSTGESPLSKATDWLKTTCPTCGKEAIRETNTMPQWGGSCWYYLRYIDPKNKDRAVEKSLEKYWMNVDLYIGGAEHAVLHLLYARFWHKVLYELGYVSTSEPFQKLINQGMIQGRSNFVYRSNENKNLYISKGLKDEYACTKLHVDISLVKKDILDIEKFKNSEKELKEAKFILEDEKYVCGWEIEKMSKSKYNVVNPDEIIEKYGADTLRMYEMFLGPIEYSKPWNTLGIEGVHKFLKKLWGLFFPKTGFILNEEKPTHEELKILHKLIKKIEEDVHNLSLNTSVSAFMIAVNELIGLKCHKKEILLPLLVCLSPFAPHICEELWQKAGNKVSIQKASYPKFESNYLQENCFEYPVSINGKLRTKITFEKGTSNEAIEKEVLADEMVVKWMKGKTAKRIIIVSQKIINIAI